MNKPEAGLTSGYGIGIDTNGDEYHMDINGREIYPEKMDYGTNNNGLKISFSNEAPETYDKEGFEKLKWEMAKVKTIEVNEA